MRRFAQGRGSPFAFGIMVVFPLLPMACGGESDTPPPAQEAQPGGQPLSQEAQTVVNQGNAALRADMYEEAMERFRQAMEMHPDHPVPQFGGLMAAMALGDSAQARDLRERLTETGPDLLEMLGPGGAMGGGMPGAGHMPEGAMPPGHPNVEEGQPGDTTGSGGIIS